MPAMPADIPPPDTPFPSALNWTFFGRPLPPSPPDGGAGDGDGDGGTRDDGGGSGWSVNGAAGAGGVEAASGSGGAMEARWRGRPRPLAGRRPPPPRFPRSPLPREATPAPAPALYRRARRTGALEVPQSMRFPFASPGGARGAKTRHGYHNKATAGVRPKRGQH